MQLFHFLFLLLFLDFVWSVTAFVFNKPHPLHLFFSRFWLLPVWFVYLLLLLILVVEAVKASFLFKYFRTVWVRQPNRFGTPRLESYFQANSRPTVVIPPSSAPRDITSATPTTPRRPFANV